MKTSFPIGQTRRGNQTVTNWIAVKFSQFFVLNFLRLGLIHFHLLIRKLNSDLSNLLVLELQSLINQVNLLCHLIASLAVWLILLYLQPSRSSRTMKCPRNLKRLAFPCEAVAIVFMAFLRLFACLELVWASDLIEWTMLFSSPEN